MKTPISTYVTVDPETRWVRWLPNSLPAAGYLTLKNSSDNSIDVTKVTSPDYQRVTLYQTVKDGESSKVVKVDKITIPAKGEFNFVPGSYHLMFEKPTHLITPGDNARTIFFLSTGKVTKVRIPVRTSAVHEAKVDPAAEDARLKAVIEEVNKTDDDDD
ncbi:copper chaperone PCu(A)C [Streptomyces vietnamensis]|uniref:copper chaperone PCu(A)C n=1 Tax=Streptomyces vietnamensis TaxID=362257 RepID=UPI0006965A74|nr:copper chaperone PCu(A)C [Streptomyces vietnamensis]